MATISTFTIEATIPGHPARVYVAWTRPERLERWFAPAGWTIRNVEVVLRLGGHLRLEMVDPVGNAYPAEFVYREISAMQRLVFTTTDWDEDPADPAAPIATVTFTPVAGATRLVFTGEGDDGLRDGWSHLIDNLAALLA